MKRFIINACIAAAAMLTIPQQADAQFLKKLKKAAESVLSTDTKPQQSSSTNATPATEFVTSAKGVSIANPQSKHFDVEFLSAEGDKASNTVTIYVKATAKQLNYSNAHVGGRNDGRAYDSDGNEYKESSYGEAKTLTVGVPVKFQFAKFEKVPATVSSFVVVYEGYYLNTEIFCPSGNTFVNNAIQLKNVPIEWK